MSRPEYTSMQAQLAALRQRVAQLEHQLAEQSCPPEQLREQDRLATLGAATIQLGRMLTDSLNGMYLMVQLIERRVTKSGIRKDGRFGGYVRTLRREMQGLARLLQEFRAFSQPCQLVLQPTNIAALLGELLTAETPQYIKQGIGVEREFPPDLPRVPVDADALRQVFQQLCQNAVDAMPDGGTLSVRLSNSDSQVRIEIADTGIGIPEDVPIFLPWVTTKARGTGLGLPLVQHLVTAHAGQIHYTSTPGQGTTFTLSFPLTPPGQTGRS